MLNTSLIINELACRIGNEIPLVVICCVSALCAHAIPMALTSCVSAIPRALAKTHYFENLLTLTVKIHTLGSNVTVTLSRSLVWLGSL